MNIGPRALAMIKSFEGLRLKAYPDPATGGVPWTIGYGSTAGVKPGMRITEDQAEALLRTDLAKFERGVTAMLAGAPTTKAQFGGMVSLAFNVGLANLANSTLLRKHLAGDYEAAAAQFGRWNRAAGKVMAGLTRRRAAEAAFYRGDA